MRNKELTATIALLKRFVVDPRLETAQKEKLTKGKSELVKLRQSGNLNRDRSRVYRAVYLLATTLQEIVADSNRSEVEANPSTLNEARRAR